MSVPLRDIVTGLEWWKISEIAQAHLQLGGTIDVVMHYYCTSAQVVKEVVSFAILISLLKGICIAEQSLSSGSQWRD